MACSTAIEELTLKSSATTELRVLFDDAWLVQVREQPPASHGIGAMACMLLDGCLPLMTSTCGFSGKAKGSM